MAWLGQWLPAPFPASGAFRTQPSLGETHLQLLHKPLALLEANEVLQGDAPIRAPARSHRTADSEQLTVRLQRPVNNRCLAEPNTQAELLLKDASEWHN